MCCLCAEKCDWICGILEGNEIKVVMECEGDGICHGNKLLLGKNVGKSRVVGVWERIFIPDLWQKIKDLGCDMVWMRKRNIYDFVYKSIEKTKDLL